MSDYIDDFDSEDAGLIDQAAAREIIEKATDALRGLGLTVQGEVPISIVNGQTVMMLPVLIRPSAKKKLREDAESREQFNKMMADQHASQIEQERQRIAELAKDPEKLRAALFGDQEESSCEHFAPDGLCVHCGAEV